MGPVGFPRGLLRGTQGPVGGLDLALGRAEGFAALVDPLGLAPLVRPLHAPTGRLVDRLHVVGVGEILAQLQEEVALRLEPVDVELTAGRRIELCGPVKVAWVEHSQPRPRDPVLCVPFVALSLDTEEQQARQIVEGAGAGVPLEHAAMDPPWFPRPALGSHARLMRGLVPREPDASIIDERCDHDGVSHRPPVRRLNHGQLVVCVQRFEVVQDGPRGDRLTPRGDRPVGAAQFVVGEPVDLMVTEAPALDVLHGDPPLGHRRALVTGDQREHLPGRDRRDQARVHHQLTRP